jgi:cobalt-zinc-cadmium efflux system outer membrane protein
MNKPQSNRRLLFIAVLTIIQLLHVVPVSNAQTIGTQPSQDDSSSLTKYMDTVDGMTADQAVAYALAHNGELAAARREIDAARALVKQARLRANPRIDASVSQNVTGTDNNITINGMLPLELGGRRSARITVAEREVEVREQMVADHERSLAADVRAKFGEALAAILKLGFDEDLIATSRRGYKLVVARVIEGRTAPLEQNMVLVEVNRLRSMRETSEGRVQVTMFELRNMMGMLPEDPLRLRGDFDNLITPLPPVAEATERALSQRPDLLATRAIEKVAEAQIEQTRSTGRLDASLIAGYQRMKFGFPVRGIDDAGRLQPVQGNFNYLTFGVSLDLPVRNKNQGAIEAAVAQSEAVKTRREFVELTIRREVAAAYARYTSAARAAEIFRVGVRDQANQNLDVVRQTYELGSKTLLDYIAEQRRYIELENGYIDALLDTYKARVEIERAIASIVVAPPQVTKK